MEALEPLSNTLHRKKGFRLHIPIQYIPLCNNVHAEKEFVRSHLKSKSIDHSRFLFNKPEQTSSPKIEKNKTINFDFLTKKKIREIVSTYNLNSKLTLEKKIYTEHEERIKKERATNFVSLVSPILTSEKNQQTILNEVQKNNPIVKEKIITKTGLKIYGQDKYNQAIIKELFKNVKLNVSMNKKFLKKKKKYKKKKPNSQTKKEQDKFDSNETHNKEDFKTEMIALWRYNILTDNFEFNDNDEELQLELFDPDNIENYLNRKKRGTYDLALRRLKYSKKAYEENELQIQRNKRVIDKISSKKNLDHYDINNIDDENDEDKDKNEEMKTTNNEENRLSLPIISKKRNNNEKINKELKSTYVLNSSKKIIENTNHRFLAESAKKIEKICKNEHNSHKSLMKILKIENNIYQGNIRKIKKDFESLT